MLGQVGRAFPPAKDWESLGILREELHLLWPGTSRWEAGLQEQLWHKMGRQRS